MATEVTTCYRHPERRAGVKCQRCGRWICPDCMIPASVGFQCPGCVRSAPQRVVRGVAAARSFVPYVTYVLLAVNVAVFFLDALTAGAPSGGGLLAIGGSGELAEQGWLLGSPVTVSGLPVPEFGGVAGGEWWRIATSGFLHADLLHLGMNMLFLWILGPMLERELGRVNFGVLYVVSLLGGAVGVLLLSPFDPTLGASGALFGMLGGAVALQLNRGINPWSTGIGGLILINVIITFAIPSISVGGHLGGLVAGFACGWILVELDERVRTPFVAPLVASSLGVAFVLACFWAADYAVANAHAVIDL